MSKTLLLADDSVVIQKLVGLSFANEDVEIVTTDNGDDAVVRAREITPDVVLADVVMPGKSGYEVCEEIKQDPALAHVPVLLLTGTFEAFDEARAAQSGANGQITKPFEAQALVERVNEVLNASAAAASTAEPPPLEGSEDDYDFFDSDVSTLSAAETQSPITIGASTTDQTPAIGADDDPLFGAPGEGANEDLEPHAGGLALGESVAGSVTSENDATIAVLPDAPPPLPPSAGDPLVAFEDDLGLDDMPELPPALPTAPVDLDSALDAVPSDPGATIVAAVDDKNAATSPNMSAENSLAGDDTRDDLTVHSPSSAIDHDVAAAPSPAAVAIGAMSRTGRAAVHAENAAGDVAGHATGNATVVANLDVSLAQPAAGSRPAPPEALDLGPSNVSPDELDFAFDVSEQVSAADLPDAYSESFSSLMDISESQILAGPPDTESAEFEASAASTSRTANAIPDDSIAAGYDVSSSDLATAPPTRSGSAPDAPPGALDDSIAVGVSQDDTSDGSQDRSQGGESPHRQEPTADAAADLARAIAHSNPSADTSSDSPGLELAEVARPSGHEERVADLSPMMEQRIQETLEKVAWEAFSDLSESIVKQVIGRVEQIAWEVIPQMAETLVREEIRRMKGEKD